MAAKRIDATDDADICTSIIVACELRYGIVKRASKRLLDQLEAILNETNIMPFDKEADHHYANIHCDLERKGMPIGAHDLLIAAHTLALGAVLVTDNVREFQRVPGLKIENWLRPTNE
jgi:tRNA(fMet)-specific endonuclease VapC